MPQAHHPRLRIPGEQTPWLSLITHIHEPPRHSAVRVAYRRNPKISIVEKGLARKPVESSQANSIKSIHANKASAQLHRDGIRASVGWRGLPGLLLIYGDNETVGLDPRLKVSYRTRPLPGVSGPGKSAPRAQALPTRVKNGVRLVCPRGYSTP